MIIFENDGEIDPRAVRILGANVKECDSPIGYFGTGLKYSIAVLLRLRQEVTILSGEEVFRFTTETTKIRGKDFELIFMNGQELGFTTDFGKAWELWMVYRELYSNAVDERGHMRRAQVVPTPTKNKTFIVVKGDEFDRIYHDRHLVILSSPPLAITDSAEIHEGPTRTVFYRNIKVGNPPYNRMGAFTFNVLFPIDLTEDRTIKYPFQVEKAMTKAIVACGNEDIIKTAITATGDYAENHLDFSECTADEVSPAFIHAVEEVRTKRLDKISDSAITLFERKVARPLGIKEIRLSDVQEASLARALAFCSKVGFHIERENVRVTSALSEEVLGTANKGIIYLTESCFSFGVKTLAGTLIEEHLHIAHEFKDCTREMQDYLLRKLISTLEEHVWKEPL